MQGALSLERHLTPIHGGHDVILTVVFLSSATCAVGGGYLPALSAYRGVRRTRWRHRRYAH